MPDDASRSATPRSWRKVVRWIVGGVAGLFGLLILVVALSPRKPLRPSKPDLARGEIQFSHALVLPVRRADEPQFTSSTRRVSVEVYRDATGRMVYISRPDLTRKGNGVAAVDSR